MKKSKTFFEKRWKALALLVAKLVIFPFFATPFFHAIPCVCMENVVKYEKEMRLFGDIYRVIHIIGGGFAGDLEEHFIKV